jgi:hypothetical protein
LKFEEEREEIKLGWGVRERYLLGEVGRKSCAPEVTQVEPAHHSSESMLERK